MATGTKPLRKRTRNGGGGGNEGPLTTEGGGKLRRRKSGGGKGKECESPVGLNRKHRERKGQKSTRKSGQGTNGPISENTETKEGGGGGGGRDPGHTHQKCKKVGLVGGEKRKVGVCQMRDGPAREPKGGQTGAQGGRPGCKWGQRAKHKEKTKGGQCPKNELRERAERGIKRLIIMGDRKGKAGGRGEINPRIRYRTRYWGRTPKRRGGSEKESPGSRGEKRCGGNRQQRNAMFGKKGGVFEKELASTSARCFNYKKDLRRVDA